nr:hypothetical protein [Chelativorans xinjiangense]
MVVKFDGLKGVPAFDPPAEKGQERSCQELDRNLIGNAVGRSARKLATHGLSYFVAELVVDGVAPIRNQSPVQGSEFERMLEHRQAEGEGLVALMLRSARPPNFLEVVLHRCLTQCLLVLIVGVEGRPPHIGAGADFFHCNRSETPLRDQLDERLLQQGARASHAPVDRDRPVIRATFRVHFHFACSVADSGLHDV